MSDASTDQVTADAPVAAKERKPRTLKDPRDFGPTPEKDAKFKMPDKLPDDKGALRQMAAKAGLMPTTAASYLKPVEIKAALKNEFPITAGPYVGYRDPNDESGRRVVNSLDELLVLAADRKEFYVEVERPRAKERTAARNEALGELAEKFPGRGDDARRARIKARLEQDAPWVPVGTEAQRAEDRFYDIDGVAGRKTFYTIVPEAQLKQDGTPRANASTLQMSPQVYEQLIKGDAEFEALVKVPEGFNVAPKKERAPKAEGEAKPARKRSKKASNAAALEAADAAAGMPSESLDDAVGATAPAGDIPDL